MRKIFLTQRLVKATGYDETRECLDIHWYTFLKKTGLIPIAVPIKADLQDYFNEFKPDGILLTGGNDISCCDPTNPLNKMRDDFENKLIKCAIHYNLPILGVCRGMQIIACYFGSTLAKMPGHVTQSHPIEFNDKNNFISFYDRTFHVNSSHNYSIINVSDVFKVAARMTQDNIVEAIEHVEHNISGMMWHPERVDPFNNCDITFFKNYFGKKIDL